MASSWLVARRYNRFENLAQLGMYGSDILRLCPDTFGGSPVRCATSGAFASMTGEGKSTFCLSCREAEGKPAFLGMNLFRRGCDLVTALQVIRTVPEPVSH